MPFLEQVLKGHIEYTHSATEAGRDIVVFTSDPLGKEKIYCIQVKVTDISYGAAAFGGIFHTLMTAKREGVTLTDGRSRKPHEVWFINSATFPENERRQVRSSLEELDLNNIRVIAGEEFAHLLEQRTPDLARSLLSSDARTISDLSKQLFSHPESRAFGVLPDKQVNDFYVTATLSPSHEDAYLAIDGRLEINKTALEVADVGHRVGDPWWREALNFWASIRGSIDDLLELLQKDERLIPHAQQVAEMAKYAPFTSPGAMEALRDSLNAKEDFEAFSEEGRDWAY